MIVDDERARQTGPQRLGRGFIAVAWVLGLYLFYLIFDGLLTRQHNPNRQLAVRAEGPSVEVVLQRNRMGHYVASGTINGQPVVFMLDTGATDVAVPESVARRLGLARGDQIRVLTANGVASAWRTRLDSVALGPLELSDVRGSIVPGMGGEQVLLGMSFLGQVEMIQRGDELMLRR